MTSIPAHCSLPGAPATSTAGHYAARLANISKRIDGRDVLRDLTLDVGSGTFVALFGANGAGKSTLLRILATLLRPSSGRLELFGQSASFGGQLLRARVGLIGHSLMLYRDLSARENLEFFGRLYGVSAASRRATMLLELLGLADRADDPVKTLSRGMAQRVAIARALMHSPELILADEPFTGLDTSSCAIVEKCLREANVRGTTVVVASHESRQCLSLARRAIVLRAGGVAMDEPCAGLDPAAVAEMIGGAA